MWFWYVATRSWIKRRSWLVATLLLFVLILIIVPKPWSKIDLGIDNNALLSHETRGFVYNISGVLPSIFAVAPLFQKYDLAFTNMSDPSCDQDVILSIDKSSELGQMAGIFFGEKLDEDGENIYYKIQENSSKEIKSFSKDSMISFNAHVFLSKFDLNPENELTEHGYYPSPTCPEFVDRSILKTYAKPNVKDWTTSLFELMFISIVLISAIRGISSSNV